MAMIFKINNFIEKSKIIHNNKYDYSKVKFINKKRKVCIICPIHGEFFQTTCSHSQGYGCYLCGNKNKGPKDTLEKFIEKANKIHKGKYDYSKSNYIKSKNDIDIICKIHGLFKQCVESHVKGSGCPKCVNVYVPTPQEFIERAKLIHRNKFDYSKTNYINTKTPIIISCPKHGDFLQLPKSHLKGDDCLKCSKENSRLTTSEFIKKSKTIHNNKYDYSKVNYIKNNIKVIITCLTHGDFPQKPHSHLIGSGCPKCTHIISKPETKFLDYLKIPDTKENRQKRILRFNIDGYDDKTNTIYEFLGDYYHGNPEIYNPNDYNKINRKKFGELYNKTLKKFNTLKSMGYTIKYIWEKDWNKWNKTKEKTIPLQEYQSPKN